MDIYKTSKNRSYVTVTRKLSESDAIKVANQHFRTSIARIRCSDGWVKDDLLYFKEEPGAEKVWLLWKKTKDEL